MAWEKGQSGNPRGRKAEKPFRDQISLVLNEYEEIYDDNGKTRKVKKLRLLAEVIVRKALDGDAACLKEVGDRIDGKPIQQLDMTVKDATPSEVTDDVLNDIIADYARRRGNGASKKANGSKGPDSVH